VTPYFILMGAFSSAFFSALLGIVGCAKLLQAIARYFHPLSFSFQGQFTFISYAVFSRHRHRRRTHHGSSNNILPNANNSLQQYQSNRKLRNNDIPINLHGRQSRLFSPQVLSFLMFMVNNRISSAPNFRPSFHYFRWYTAFIGVLVSFATMYFVDGVYATVAAAFMFSLFLLIHYFCPPKAWGDVTQSLIYHQVRKFLLRLDTRKGNPPFKDNSDSRTRQVLAASDIIVSWKSSFTMAIHSIL
jgi:solute carrier family 12 (potassium/chloride transporters), member 9